ncbi:MAG TPA: class I SAM-dependent methyltransferase [Thermoleophilaceae bacterium]|nr:class I SAM-dependent methyltransferase [Thermoleophilaceae bacterium]
MIAVAAEEPLPHHVLDRIRRTRHRPAPTQPDYLHLRYLVAHIRAALAEIGPAAEVLDVYCGTSPYDDLLPGSPQVTRMDIDNRYGHPDVVSSDFLPFEDGRFDLVVCYEAFHYAPDPVAATAELARVLRPGGHALVTVPLVWQYDRTVLEHRFTGPSLRALFADWEVIRVVENGGRAVSWALLTGSLVNLVEESSARRGSPPALRGVFAAVYLVLNALAVQMDRLERRLTGGPHTLPPNLLVAARRPPHG